MSEDWSKWFKRRKMWPFAGRWPFEDVDDIFREIDQFMEKEFGELSKRAPRNLVRERTLPDGTKVNELGPFVYGYSMTIGPDGKPQIREFGNIAHEARLGRPHIDIKEEREPLTDIINTNGEVKVVVELPGVEKEAIKVHGTENSLTISVDSPQRKYYREIELPANIDIEQVKSSYKNGVLEITLPKKKEKQPKGKPINID